MVCWGANTYGQLGDGTTERRLGPVSVAGLRDVIELAVGGYHTCARTQDNAVWCWGANYRGQLGLGTTKDQTTPQRIIIP